MQGITPKNPNESTNVSNVMNAITRQIVIIVIPIIYYLQYV